TYLRACLHEAIWYYYDPCLHCYLFWVFQCKPHSLCTEFSHHHLPDLWSSSGFTARVHGSQPILGYPRSCNLLYGTLFFCRSSISIFLIDCLVLVWSLLRPVIHASRLLSALASGLTFLTLQQSFLLSILSYIKFSPFVLTICSTSFRSGKYISTVISYLLRIVSIISYVS